MQLYHRESRVESSSFSFAFAFVFASVVVALFLLLLILLVVAVSVLLLVLLLLRRYLSQQPQLVSSSSRSSIPAVDGCQESRN